jgi:hypothetical protein
MIYCELKGGLGNQLFQVFATIACAMRENRSFLFLRNEITGIRSTYWNSLFSRLFIHTIDSCIHAEEIYKEPFFSYHPMVIMGNHGHGSLKTTHIDGYFQSPRYFEDKFDIICSFLKIDKFKKQFESSSVDYNKTVSLHIRHGDYAKYPLHHPILPIAYYINALKTIETIDPTVDTVLLFYEDEEEPIKKMVHTLQSLFHDRFRFQKAKANNDWKEMLEMSLCRLHIIANSTFSWWGAYLNHNKEKGITMYPSLWFGPALKQNDTKDLFPSHWIKINVS